MNVLSRLITRFGRTMAFKRTQTASICQQARSMPIKTWYTRRWAEKCSTMHGKVTIVVCLLTGKPVQESHTLW